MSTHYQIPRNSLAWIFLAQFAVILPHITRLPGWLIVLSMACAAWRILVFVGRASFPPWWARGLLVLTVSSGVLFTYGTLLQLQPMIAILVGAFYLKLLEMRRRRDAYVIVFLSYFIIATDFIYTQSIAISLYLFFCVILSTTALIGLTQSQGYKNPLHSFSLATKLILQSIPLMVVAFVFFPRLPPLWSVTSDDSIAQTGMSDTLSPGDFSGMIRSPEVVFRASFETAIPNHNQLYWRGLAFDYFDGRRWTRSKTPEDNPGTVRWFGQKKAAWERDIVLKGNALRYTVLLEQTRQRWLYSLPLSAPGSWGSGITRDFNLVANKTPSHTYGYTAEAHLDYNVDLQMPDDLRKQYLQLPAAGNTKTRELAHRWKRESQDGSDVVAKALAHYQQTFTYTLRPPKLGADSIDEFLFVTQQGFCEHFASSFVFLMRSADIPARVVVGYQGGEINAYENYLLVHQFDAHAWAEVWLDDVGWTRVDPTSAVAPERIERGISYALANRHESDYSGLSALRFRNLPFLSSIRLRMDQLHYSWARLVLGYQPARQRQVITQLLGEFTAERIALALLALSSLSIGIVALLVFRQRAFKECDPATTIYLRFCTKLEKAGLVRLTGEAPGDFALRASRARPDLAARIQAIQDLFYRLVYVDAGGEKHQIKAFEAEVSTFRPGKPPAP